MGTPFSWKSLLPTAALASLLFASYSNHFDNAFHFDDFHTIVDNAAVHSLANWRQFFTDPAAFSVLTTHQVYRPLLTLSLAADWALAGGAVPRWFHITSFAWFLVLAFVLRALFMRLLGSPLWAWFAAALFALHPVSAETVNYIIQRGDVLATLAIAAALLLYIRSNPLYLLVFLAGALSKTTALVFPLLLAAYIGLYEERRWRRLLPALGVTLAAGLLASRMIGPGFTSGAASAGHYRATQGYVAWHYFTQFFWPAHLTADTDMTAVAAFADPRVAGGFLFLAAAAAAIYWTRVRNREVAFGLAWFLIALLPTALTPLAEVANDHRMFMAFPGLCLAAAALVRHLPRPRLAAAGAALILAACAAGVYARNQVWLSEESLWRDVTVKSPRNGRGLMNYGLTLMARGDIETALGYFDRAAVLNPRYHILAINRAIANGQLNRPAQAEAHFRDALSWNPDQSNTHFYYGRWLWANNRRAEARERLLRAVALNPRDFHARALLADVHAAMQEWRELDLLTAATLELAPADSNAFRHRAALQATQAEAARAQAAASASATPERYLELSLAHFRAGRYMDCVQAARQALRLRPGYAEAYNNIAAGYNALHMWDEGIRAASEAVRLRPDWDLARNNLKHAQASKAAGAK